MASKKRPRAQPKASKSKVSHEGITFSSASQRSTYDTLFTTKHYSYQVFAHEPTLTDLGIIDGVTELFENIGWDGILGLNYYSYMKPTVELLSSASLKDGMLSFRLLNRNHQLSEDQICSIIEAPTENTFKANFNRIEGFKNHVFWSKISNETEYEARSAKASRILHPTLRVAHRILASVVFPREDRSTVTAPELRILYCMVHNHPVKPHFGSFICDRIMSATTSNHINCTGYPAMLLARLGLAIPEDIPKMSNSIFLDKAAFIRCGFYKSQGDGIRWTVDPDSKTSILITSDDDDALNLVDPTHDTDWKLSMHAPLQAQPRAPALESAPTPTDTGDAGSSDTTTYPPPHELLSRLESMQSSIDSIGTRVDKFQSNFDTFQVTYNQDIANLTRLLNGLQARQPDDPPHSS